MADDLSRQFFDIANAEVSAEANKLLDKHLARVDQWCVVRAAHNDPADLRSLIEQIMQEPNHRAPVIVTLAAALWRLREERTNAQK
jgi:hypothetical protein